MDQPTQATRIVVLIALVPATLVSWLGTYVAVRGMFGMPSRAVEAGYDAPLTSPSDGLVIAAFVVPIAVVLTRATWMFLMQALGRETRFLTRAFGLFLVLFVVVPLLVVAVWALTQGTTELLLSVVTMLVFLGPPAIAAVRSSKG